ncbi:MAG: hemin uptake protein HemP [Dechloromonas sp.]|nr:MAG: hemin uptake protein HemP [Dechloromonas sp.]
MDHSNQTLRIPFLHAHTSRGTLSLKRDKTGEGAIADPADKRISSKALFGDANEICITHSGSAYRLRITRQDKLILTK